MLANFALRLGEIAMVLLLLIASLVRRLDRLLAAYPAGAA
jgi:hypothetical protein